MLRQGLIESSQVGEGFGRGGHAAVFQGGQIPGRAVGGCSQQILHPSNLPWSSAGEDSKPVAEERAWSRVDCVALLGWRMHQAHADVIRADAYGKDDEG